MNTRKYSIISNAGYGTTGSGIITDYLHEFACIKNLGDYEFRFLQDHDGISTLEDTLVHTPHRLNSDVAIRNYQRYIDRQCGTFLNRRYEAFFKGQWRKISNIFLEKLISIEWPGYWEEFQIVEPRLSVILKYQLLPRILRLSFGNTRCISHYIPKKDMFFSYPTEAYFLQCVKEYVHNLCSVIDPEHDFKYVFMDQLMPPTNIGRYERYMDSVKTIVVDRDPRDCYIENVLQYEEGWIPKDIDKYILHYRGIREQTKRFPDSENVLRIRFEDAIFHYDVFDEKIRNFLGLSQEDHTAKYSCFNPDVSIKNTRLWASRKVAPDIIKKIEAQLAEYCYDF